MRDLREMYSAMGYYNSTFKAKLYMDSTRQFYNKFHEIFEELNAQAVEASEEIDQIYEIETEEKKEIKEIKKNVFLRRMQNDEIPVPDRPKLTPEMQKIVDGIADEFIEETRRCVCKNGKPPKGKKSVDLAIYEVMYIFPGFMETGGQFAYEIAASIGNKWPAAMNGNKLSCADYKTIDSGFKRKLCYITTAVCDSLGKPDDCEELTLLRGFRDGYMMKSEEGRKLVEEYYECAPGIVMRTYLAGNSTDVYDSIYKKYIIPCTDMIKSGQYEKCMKHYTEMVKFLS